MQRIRGVHPVAVLLSMWVLLPLQASPENLSGGGSNVSILEDHSFANASGVISVNEAAGTANQQNNARSVAVNPGGAAVARTISLQSRNDYAVPPAQAVTEIGAHAFANLSGIAGINQVSGSGNRQVNGVALAIGIKGKVIADNVLADSHPDAAGLVGTEQSQPGSRTMSVDHTAFQGAHGIVQLNQTGGVGNSSSNSFALRLSVEPKL